MGADVTVAVVEDDPDLRELHRIRLTPEYLVETFTDGRTALDRINDQEVLLLDRNLPAIDGDTVARQLRKDGYQGAIAMVTSQRPDPAIASVPIDEYVRKPVDRDSLLSIVDRLEHRLDASDSVRALLAMVTRRYRLEDAHPDGSLSRSDSYQSLTRQIEREYHRVRNDEATRTDITTFAKTVPTADDRRSGITDDLTIGESIDPLGRGQEL
ncbi:MAG: response regulator transcription factor [Halorhabdus sp.]